MPYNGGKHFQAGKIATYLNGIPAKRRLEPFCGSMKVTAALGNVDVAADICQPLITMWLALRDGWVPPDYVSEDCYREHKARQDPHDPMTAFVGFWHSFGGKWFAGYQRYWNGEPHPMPKPGGAARQVLKTSKQCASVDIRCCDYREIEAVAGDLVYYDPPYDGTTSPGERHAFDSLAFWEHARKQHQQGVKVFVSEASAPDDFEPVLVLSAPARLSASGGNKARRYEALYAPRST